MSEGNTLLKWITQTADNEPIEAVVLGEKGDLWYGKEEDEGEEKAPLGKVLSLSEAMPFIQYEFDNGYGAPECHAITAYTKSWVIFVVQYDGSTAPYRVPRNPIDHMPEMPGV